MIIWINGAFGSGKTAAAFEINRRLKNSFVYDPENVGYFIRHNTPGIFSTGDFQNIQLWREINYEMLKMISENYGGTVLVPMTLVNSDYYSEIVERLKKDGVDLKHFILYTSREETMRRLKKRSLPFAKKDRFAIDSIDRCLKAFDISITETKIYTDQMKIENIADKIAELCNLQISPDKKTRIEKLLYRLVVTLKHIRR